MNLGFEAPRDAYAVKDAVDACGEARLVRERALVGTPPDWTPEPVVYWEQGPPIYGRMHAKKRRLSIIGYQVFAHGDLAAIVDERRATYQRWARALHRLRARLAAPGCLVDHVLVDDLPPLAPWDQICRLAGDSGT